jgi:uncharacterized protein HemX
MDEQERDHLRQQIRKLAQSNRRWKLATFTSLFALVVVLIMGGVSSFMLTQLELQRQRAMMQLEQTTAAEQTARLEAEQAAQLHQMDGRAK